MIQMQKRLPIRIWLITIILSVLTGCTQGTGPSPGSSDIPSPIRTASANNSAGAASVKTSSLLWNFQHSFSYSNSIWSSMSRHFELPDASNRPEVKAQIRWFQSNPKYLNRIFNNSAPFIYYVYEQTKKRGLPAEVALLPFIESSYSPFDYSRVGAIGLWQMMPGTASGFHIKINYWYDGRRDLVASTNAALTYLTYLDAYFNNNWLLAFAAYNAGEGKIQSVAHRSYNELGSPVDFWHLNHLPQETKSYVPKLLAIVAIVKDPARYGVTLPPVPNQPYLQAVQIDSQIDLNKAASLANLEPSVLRRLNPGFRRAVTDPDGPHMLLLPANNVDTFKTNLAMLPQEERFAMKSHHVKPGESLKHIASLYHTTAEILMEINHLSEAIVHKGQDLLIPQAFAHSQREVSSIVSEDKVPGPKRVMHTMKKGETLAAAAHRYGVKVQEIRAWNNLLDEHVTKPGEQLLVWEPSKHHLAGNTHNKKLASHSHKHHAKRHVTHAHRNSA